MGDERADCGRCLSPFFPEWGMPFAGDAGAAGSSTVKSALLPTISPPRAVRGLSEANSLGSYCPAGGFAGDRGDFSGIVRQETARWFALLVSEERRQCNRFHRISASSSQAKRKKGATQCEKKERKRTTQGRDGRATQCDVGEFPEHLEHLECSHQPHIHGRGAEKRIPDWLFLERSLELFSSSVCVLAATSRASSCYLLLRSLLRPQ